MDVKQEREMEDWEHRMLMRQYERKKLKQLERIADALELVNSDLNEITSFGVVVQPNKEGES